MAKITASLSTKVDARGKSEILLRFVAGRDFIFRIHSDIYIAPERWKDGGIVIPRIATPEQAELKASKARLDSLIAHILDTFTEADKDVVTRDWMQDQVDRFHHPDKLAGAGTGFDELFTEFIRLKDVSDSRRRRYQVTARALRKFEEDKGRSLTVNGVTVKTLEAFREYLEKDDTRGKNVVIQYLDVLRTFYHWLNHRGITRHNPFDNFQTGTAVYGTPYYLTIQERDAIYQADLSEHPALAAQRDIFVFQCLVGCRVGDLLRFKKGDVDENVLSYIPRKTREGHPVVVRVPLNETAKEILARYAGFQGDRLLPFISAQKYNDAIKEILKAAGITRTVTILDPLTRKEVKKPLNEVASSHLARRTFVGNLYRQVKDPALIGSMTGHVEGSKAFARYRDIDDDIKKDTVKLLENR